MKTNVVIACFAFFAYVSLHAASSNHFGITNEQYRLGVLSKSEESCVGKPGQILLSFSPKFPLAANVLYWRHKEKSSQYTWYSDSVSSDCFGKLYAFNLKKNRLNPHEAAYTRFYGNPRIKPYQDEADLYFDVDYIYSARVPTLYYMKNGQLGKMESEPLPGILKMESSVAPYSFILNDQNYGSASKLFPLSPGLLYGTLSAPGYFAYVDGALILSGKETTLNPIWVPLDTVQGQIKTTIQPEIVNVARSLEEVEVLHDLYIKELHQIPDSAFVDNFDSIYPKPKEFFFRLEDEDAYQQYLDLYTQKRTQAKELWNESKVKNVKAVYVSLRSKLDSLEQLPWRGLLQPDSARIVLIPSLSSTPKIDSIEVVSNPEVELVFKGPENRFDVIWRGVVENLNTDSLASNLSRNAEGLLVFLTLAENKPLWIQEDGLVKSRHQYRYIKIEFERKGKVFPGTGTFILPHYIASHAEVQDWLQRKDSVRNVPVIQVPVEEKLIEESIKDSVKIEPVKDTVKRERLVKDDVRGDHVKIDSGAFSYKGRVVYLSPFSINTTEITQSHFSRIMAKEYLTKKDSKIKKSKKKDANKEIKNRSTFEGPDKPVHNVTWHVAKQFCEIIGGSLPTEAQWEYAARAGNNDGLLWNLDAQPNARTYAVYKENSYKKKKKDPLYGPQNVASKKANEWGLFDMSGNVAEWTIDKYSLIYFKGKPSNPKGASFGNTRIFKGGSWKDKEKHLDLREYDDEDPRFWSDNIGFRCVFPR